MTFKTGIASIGAAVAAVGMMASVAMADAPPASKKVYAAKEASAPAEGYDRPHIGNWGGLYVGINAGWIDSSVKWDLATRDQLFQFSDVIGANNTSASGSDAILGGHVGFQHQMGRIVVGVEGAWSGSGAFDNGFHGGSDCLVSNAPYVLGCRSRMDSIITIGPRIGLVHDNFMLYMTGGWASGRIDTKATVTSSGIAPTLVPGQDFYKASSRHNGWYLGAGVEYALHDRWIVGLEYQHVELDTKSLSFADRSEPPFVNTVGQRFGRNVDGDADIVRFRLSYKLGRADHSAGEAMK